MAVHTFDVTAFRLQFPQFADETKYPDDLLAGYFSMATCYINANDSCWFSGDCLQLALNLMTAHLAAINAVEPDGSVGIATSATIDRVSVTSQVPTTKSGWQFFLAKSAYGLQLWALLQAKSVGGFIVGGSLERRAIRKAGGVF
jgi:hypothetical protein